jgi:hypothetical protein
MLQASEIKHTNATVLPAADKDIHTIGAEPNIVDFFIVGDQLRLGSQRGYIPDGTCGVNTRGDDETW